MKALPQVEHPNVEYWRCPACPAVISLNGEAFRLMAVLGMTLEPKDLADTLMPSQLAELERAVERHESDAHGLAGVTP